MATRPCQFSITCPDATYPATNYSAESPEQPPAFFSLVFPTSYDAMGCLSLCESNVSQLAADECALAAIAQCFPTLPPPAVGNTPEPLPYQPPFSLPISASGGTAGVELFESAAQTAVQACPGAPNGQVQYTLAPGLVRGVSQEVADAWAQHLAALGAAIACQNCGHVPAAGSAGRVLNQPIQGTTTCPDGTGSTYYVPAGQFAGVTQGQADDQATAYGVAQASAHQICINGPSALVGCASSANFDIPVSGGTQPIDYTIIAGSAGGLLPAPSGDGCLLAGAGTAGTYQFTLLATDINSYSTQRDFTLQLLGFTTTSLPKALDWQAYTAQVNVAGTQNGNFSVALAGGVMPPGLSVLPNGLFSGMPQVSGNLPATFTFDLAVTDTDTGLTCIQTFSITVGGIDWSQMSWDPVAYVDMLPPNDPGQALVGANNFAVTGEVYPPVPPHQTGSATVFQFFGAIVYSGPAVQVQINPINTSWSGAGNNFYIAYKISGMTTYVDPAHPNTPQPGPLNIDNYNQANLNTPYLMNFPAGNGMGGPITIVVAGTYPQGSPYNVHNLLYINGPGFLTLNFSMQVTNGGF